MLQTIKDLKWLRIVLDIIFYLVLPTITIIYLYTNNIDHKARYAQEQKTTCPSLLSIARSARDTLIIMRDKDMCTDYVLINLK